MVDPMGLFGGMAAGPGAQHFKDRDPRAPTVMPIPADPMVRISGGIKMIVGTAEVGVGYAMAPKSGGASLTLATHGFDTYQAGWNELVTGVPTRTVTAQTVTKLASAAGASPETAEWLGNAADIAVPSTAGIVGAATGSSVRIVARAPASQIQVNAQAGAAWEKTVVEEILPQTQSQVRTQITIKSSGPSGMRVRLDGVGLDDAGRVRLSDAKASATAPYTPNQKVVYPELEEYGGTVVGEGKPPFKGGTQVPPTHVDIYRPERQN